MLLVADIAEVIVLADLGSSVWIVSAVYFLSYFQRVAISAVADDLAFELRLDSVALGFMSSGFLISYALTQPIIGFLVTG